MTRAVKAWLAVSLSLGVLTSTGCKEDKPDPIFRVTFTASTDGDPLAHVSVIADGVVLGETDAAGELGAQITGREGQSIAVSAQCPEGYRAPEQIPVLTLRSFRALDRRAANRGIEMTISCPPSERLAAFVIRSLDQNEQAVPDLPVTIRGEEVARTDANGVAHLQYRMRPSATLRLSFDTSARTDLRPQNPGSTFTVPDQDEVFVMDQRFEVTRRQRRRRRPVAQMAGPTLPVRLR